MIERWGGGLFACTPKECLKHAFCPFLAYATIGGFNMADISSVEERGWEPPDTNLYCYEVTTMGFGYFNAFLCWFQGNRRKTLEVKLHTVVEPYYLTEGCFSSCCAVGLPFREAALHLFCHPCALSQEVRAVNNYKNAVGSATLKRGIGGSDCICGIFKSTFPCCAPLICLIGK